MNRAVLATLCIAALGLLLWWLLGGSAAQDRELGRAIPSERHTSRDRRVEPEPLAAGPAAPDTEPGHATPQHPARDPGSLEVVAGPPWHLSGRVLKTASRPSVADRDGYEPLAGARLRVLLDFFDARRLIAEARSDAHGRYHIDLGELKRLSAYTRRATELYLEAKGPGCRSRLLEVPGWLQLERARPGGDAKLRSAEEHLRTLPPRTSDQYQPKVDVRLEAGPTIRVRLLDAFGNLLRDFGELQRNGLVRVHRGEFEIGSAATCDSDGYFEVALPSDIEAGAALSIRGFAEAIGVSEARAFRLPGSRHLELDPLVLEGGPGLRIRVREADGRGAASVPLRFEAVADVEPDFDDEFAQSIEGSGRTDANGLFSAPHLVPGAYRVLFGIAGDDVDALAPVVLSTGNDVQEIRIPRSRLRLRVLGPDGHEMPYAEPEFVVFAGDAADEAERAFQNGRGITELLDRATYRCAKMADRHGDPIHLFAPNGSFVYLRLHLRGMRMLEQGVRMPAEAVSRRLTLRPEPLESTSSLQLRLDTRLPRSKLLVCLDDPELDTLAHSESGTTRDSRLLLAQLPPGKYRCTVRLLGQVPNEAPDVVPFVLPWQFELELRPGARIARHLPLRQGGAVQLEMSGAKELAFRPLDLVVRVRREGEQKRERIVDWHVRRELRSGRHHWPKVQKTRTPALLRAHDVLRPGNYEISVEIPGGPSFRSGLAVRPGAYASLQIPW